MWETIYHIFHTNFQKYVKFSFCSAGYYFRFYWFLFLRFTFLFQFSLKLVKALFFAHLRFIWHKSHWRNRWSRCKNNPSQSRKSNLIKQQPQLSFRFTDPLTQTVSTLPHKKCYFGFTAAALISQSSCHQSFSSTWTHIKHGLTAMSKNHNCKLKHYKFYHITSKTPDAGLPNVSFNLVSNTKLTFLNNF